MIFCFPRLSLDAIKMGSFYLAVCILLISNFAFGYAMGKMMQSLYVILIQAYVDVMDSQN